VLIFAEACGCYQALPLLQALPDCLNRFWARATLPEVRFSAHCSDSTWSQSVSCDCTVAELIKAPSWCWPAAQSPALTSMNTGTASLSRTRVSIRHAELGGLGSAGLPCSHAHTLCVQAAQLRHGLAEMLVAIRDQDDPDADCWAALDSVHAAFHGKLCSKVATSPLPHDAVVASVTAVLHRLAAGARTPGALRGSARGS
jgi:hypothetical protein